MATARLRRALAATVAAGALLLTAGCAQPGTIESYTPANGANVELGMTKVRGLVLVVDGEQAVLSGGIVSPSADTLTSVAARALTASGAEGEILAVSTKPVELAADQLTKLSDAGIAVSGKGMVPGLTAKVTLAFAKAGSVTAEVPVVDVKHPDYVSFTPRPTQAAATPSVSVSTVPLPTATPSK